MPFTLNHPGHWRLQGPPAKMGGPGRIGRGKRSSHHAGDRQHARCAGGRHPLEQRPYFRRQRKRPDLDEHKKNLVRVGIEKAKILHEMGLD